MPEGGTRPPVEYRSPFRKTDGSLVSRYDSNRPPTTFTRIRNAVSEGYTGIGDRIQHTPLGKFATWLTAWREPSKQDGHPAGPFVRAPRVGENLKAEIVGDIHPSTEDVFVDVPERPYNWKGDAEVADTVTPVTELANAATWQEIAEVKRRHPSGEPREESPVAQKLKLVTLPEEKPDKPTPPEGPSAA